MNIISLNGVESKVISEISYCRDKRLRMKNSSRILIYRSNLSLSLFIPIISDENFGNTLHSYLETKKAKGVKFVIVFFIWDLE